MRRVGSHCVAALMMLGCATVSPKPESPRCLPGPVRDGVAELPDFAAPATTDYAPALQCALEALCVGGKCGGVVRVPKGVFPISRTVTMTGATRIVGLGSVSRLSWTGATSEALLQLDATAGQAVEDVLLSTSSGDGACSDSSKPGVGIRVQGSGRGPSLRGLTICGFETGIAISGTSDGFIEDSLFAQNGTHLSMQKAEAWVGQSLLLDGAETAVRIRSTAGVRLLGGRVTKAKLGVAMEGCVGCSMMGLRFDANAVDLRFGWDASDRVRGVSLRQAMGVGRIEVSNPSACPVDGVELRDVAGLDRKTAVVAVDSACTTHLPLVQAELEVARSNTFDGTGLHDVITFEGSGFGAQGAMKPAKLGVPAGAQFDEVTQEEGRVAKASRSMLVTSDGRVLAGTDSGTAALTVSGEVNTRLDLVNGTAAHRTQDELPPRTSLNGVSLRLLDADLRPAATFAATSDGVLRVIVGKVEALAVTRGGRVGLGTTSPQSAMDVAGDARVRGVLHAKSLQVPVGDVSEPCSTVGQLQLVTSANADILRVCTSGGWQTVSLGAP